VRSERVVCWWESKASCQEDMHEACNPEGQEEGNRKDVLQGELKDMATRSSVLELLVGCWMNR
jgi:hypothetical protein